MDNIPMELQTKLEDRVREHIASEVRRDVPALYEFTLPAIRAGRMAERDDEPELSLSEIRAFVGLVEEAELESIEVEKFRPSADRFAGSPAAVVVTRVRYNRASEATKFRCLWVYAEGNWFSTALDKFWCGSQHDTSEEAACAGGSETGTS